jgi:protein-S-isoprenylcysteine O-methyltransferase Ste14
MSTVKDKAAALFVKYRRIWEYACNITLATFYLVFDYYLITDFIATHRASSLLLAIFETAIVAFSLSRPLPQKSNTSVYDWFVALTGTTIVSLFRPAAMVNDHALLLILQFVGMTVSLIGLFNLNKSWGLVAVNRGIKSGGLYRYVRHPIYAGYFLSFFSYIAQNMTMPNLVIGMFYVTLQILRIHAEEAVLSEDPAYVAYKQTTRWRVIPFIF